VLVKRLVEVSAEKTKYMFMPSYQTAGQNKNRNIAKKSFKIWQSSNISCCGNKSELH
jgi:hypothetical protein